MTTLPWQYYHAAFPAVPKWTTVELSFDKFVPASLKAKLDPSKLLRIAVAPSEKSSRPISPYRGSNSSNRTDVDKMAVQDNGLTGLQDKIPRLRLIAEEAGYALSDLIKADAQKKIEKWR